MLYLQHQHTSFWKSVCEFDGSLPSIFAVKCDMIWPTKDDFNTELVQLNAQNDVLGNGTCNIRFGGYFLQRYNKSYWIAAVININNKSLC